MYAEQRRQRCHAWQRLPWLPWSIMVHHGASWLSWCAMAIMVHHGASWCIMVHHGPSWGHGYIYKRASRPPPWHRASTPPGTRSRRSGPARTRASSASPWAPPPHLDVAVGGGRGRGRVVVGRGRGVVGRVVVIIGCGGRAVCVVARDNARNRVVLLGRRHLGELVLVGRRRAVDGLVALPLDQLRCFLGVLSGREVAREQLSQRVRVVLRADLRGRAVVLYEAIRMIMKIRTISGSVRGARSEKIR